VAVPRLSLEAEVEIETHAVARTRTSVPALSRRLHSNRRPSPYDRESSILTLCHILLLCSSQCAQGGKGNKNSLTFLSSRCPGQMGRVSAVLLDCRDGRCLLLQKRNTNTC
jgi:hypothetical protein